MEAAVRERQLADPEADARRRSSRPAELREDRPPARRRACPRRRVARAGAAEAARRRRPGHLQPKGSPERYWSRSAPSFPTSTAAAIVASPEPHSRSPLRARPGSRRRRALADSERPPRASARRTRPGPRRGDRPLAQPLDRRTRRARRRRSCLPLLEGEDAAEALPLERLVTDGEHLVEQQDVGVEERRDRESEPHRHPRRVRAHRAIDRMLELGERDDLVEPLSDVGAPEALDRAVQEDVLAPGEVEVEAGAELEERADAPLGSDAPARRLDDPGDDSQQRRLARSRSVRSGRPLPRGRLEGDVVQRPHSVACVCPRWTNRSLSVRASRAWTRNRRETPSTLISPVTIDLD